MKKNIKFSDADFREVCGTSSHMGYVKATAYEIAKVLGNPREDWNEKTTYEWQKKFGSVVFTIYDYCEPVPPRKYHLVEYHIGTKRPEDTVLIVELLKGFGFDAYMS